MTLSVASLRAKAGRIRRYLHDIGTHPDRKPTRQIAHELLDYHRAGTSRQFYFERLLYQRAVGDPADFLTKAETKALWDLKRRPDGYLRVFNDKTIFDEHLRRAGGAPFPLPTYLGQTRASVLLRPGRDDVMCQDDAAFARALAEMVDRSPTGRVFAKPVDDNQGAGAELVRGGFSRDQALLVREGVLRVDYLFQEAIDQHPAMDALHPGCLNTLRIVTGTSDDGSYPVLGAALRVGQGQRPVDNSHAGGLFVGVDRATGRLFCRAHTAFEFGGATYKRHPGTGVTFEGFEIPYFDEAVALSRRAHALLPLLYAGWDVGISPSGPILIEGNSGPYLPFMETAAGGFKADRVARAFLTEKGIVD